PRLPSANRGAGLRSVQLAVAELLHRGAAVLVRQAVEIEDAVHVIGLVLHDARLEAFRLDLDRRAVDVEASNDDRGRPAHREPQARNGQATLVDLLLALEGDDLRVRDRARAVLAVVEDEEP